jgi:cytochrome c oxidase cbb3-type subunit 4
VETYSLLRQFADSWGMLAMLLFFLGLVVYVLAGRSSSYRETAESIFRHEDKPAADPDHDADRGGAKEARR